MSELGYSVRSTMVEIANEELNDEQALWITPDLASALADALLDFRGNALEKLSNREDFLALMRCLNSIAQSVVEKPEETT